MNHVVFDGELNFPLDVKMQPDGRYRASSRVVPDHEWFGETIEHATRAANAGLEQLYYKGDLAGAQPWRRGLKRSMK